VSQDLSVVIALAAFMAGLIVGNWTALRKPPG
jgi:hypothetical protein